MFETYKKQSTDDSRYGRIALAAFICGVIYIAVFIYVTGAFEQDTPAVHTLSGNDAETTVGQNVEQLCAGLPMPEKFKFTGKHEPKNDYEQHLVVYFYSSPRPPEEILPSFLLWFNENGWRHAPGTETTFRKDNFSIYIWYDSTPTVTNYSIYCSETK